MILLLRISKVSLIILLFGDAYLSIAAVIDDGNGSHQNESGRIIGDKTNNEETWPFMAAILTQKKDENTWKHLCSGTIWDEETILTAAHCLVTKLNPTGKIIPIPVNQLTVFLGHTHLKSHRDPSYLFKVRSIRLHPAFNGTMSDIGILKLKDKIDFERKHRKACCVCEPEKNLGKWSTLNCITLGWGHIKPIRPGTGKFDTLPERLQQVVVNLSSSKSSQSCNSHPQYRKEEHLCGGISGNSTCNGDSGGPLLCQRKDRKPTVYSLVGITIFGNGECKEGASKVFTPVYSYIDWIQAEDGPKLRTKPLSDIFDGPILYYLIFGIGVGVVVLIFLNCLFRLVVCLVVPATILAIVLIAFYTLSG